MSLQTFLYKAARLLGDYKAVRKGTIHKRMKNRVIGKSLSKKLF